MYVTPDAVPPVAESGSMPSASAAAYSSRSSWMTATTAPPWTPAAQWSQMPGTVAALVSSVRHRPFET
ncbi:hypothetical protein ABZZ80_36590 [Streptomyces sp. NPDC006356]